MIIFHNFRHIKLLINNKLSHFKVFLSYILVGLEIDYTCLGGSRNEKVWEPAINRAALVSDLKLEIKGLAHFQIKMSL